MIKLFAFLTLVVFTVEPLRAIILFGSGDPAYNTTAPVFEDGTDGGWKYVGQWGDFSGTPIASYYFITAQHVGGGIGQGLVYRGNTYQTVAYFDDIVGQTDLRIWQVSVPFPDYAPLYTLGAESNQTFVCIGRGTQRGPASYVTVMEWHTYNLQDLGLTRKQAKELYPDAIFHGQEMTIQEPVISQSGWEFGVSDHVQRWGVNTWEFTGFYNIAGFNNNADPDECYLSGGDSGGACFVQVNGQWQLCAINYGIDSDGAYYLDNPYYQPAHFVCTRTFNRLDWINSVINQ